jgi:hypothetical protein
MARETKSPKKGNNIFTTKLRTASARLNARDYTYRRGNEYGVSHKSSEVKAWIKRCGSVMGRCYVK